MIARFPENIHEIHEIHEIHWMPWMRCLMRANVREAHLVTICHRPWEWPFFRVFEGERRIDGFPFGWSRNPPKSAVFGPYPWAHRIDRCGTHARVSCA